LTFDLDGPLNITVGTGYRLNDQTAFAADFTWIRYQGVSGFGSPGGVVDRIVQPFGWNNVKAFKFAIEHKLNDQMTLRGAYNHSDIPLPPRNTLTATGAPAFFKHHISFGASYQLFDHVRADFGFYHVPRSGNTGPLLTLDGGSGGTVKETNTLTSVQLGFNWRFGGERAGRFTNITGGGSGRLTASRRDAPTPDPQNGLAAAPVQTPQAQLAKVTQPASVPSPNDLVRENRRLRLRIAELEAENARLRVESEQPRGTLVSNPAPISR
jgi:long-chain fatty acid transport protein